MGPVPDKPWWRRIDGVPPGFEGSPETRDEPWTSAQLRVIRAGMLLLIVIGAAIIVGSSFNYAYIPAGVLIPGTWITVNALRWTPEQRRQFLGLHPPAKRPSS